MKCIEYTNGVERGEIVRVGDDAAFKVVQDGHAVYVPKWKYKEKQAKAGK